ncbi:hypothetical protein ACLBWX_06520 [Methylobacterium sp. M6A4_1b]
MPPIFTADFETRRDAEMSVEHLVQEHGIDRKAITVVSAGDRNSAGTEQAGGDLEGGRNKTETEGEPALTGAIQVRVEADSAQRGVIDESFSTFGGKTIQR